MHSIAYHQVADTYTLARDDIQPKRLIIYECISRHRRVMHSMIYQVCDLDKKTLQKLSFLQCFFWSGLRGSNPPPPPWQGGALPNELNPRGILFENGDSDGARLSRELRAQSFAALTVINCHSLPLLLRIPLCFRRTQSSYSSFGGDDGIRTHDPLLAGQVLSQLSYTPI